MAVLIVVLFTVSNGTFPLRLLVVLFTVSDGTFPLRLLVLWGRFPVCNLKQRSLNSQS